MSKRMYYSEAEVTEKLKLSTDELAAMVRDQKLRVYMDGSKKMYRAEEVDALVPASPEIELSPADTSGGINLSEADAPSPSKTKEDTVITAEGISIFDHEDLEVESADPMAKTQIAPSVEDQASIDGTGSGSGLLDLTRESDETSLGAEVLDHIDIEGAVGSGLESEIPEPAAPTPAQEMVMMVEQAPEALDADTGLYNGFVIGSTLVMLVLAAVTVSAMNNVMPDFVESMKENMIIVLAVFVVVAGITAVVGYMMGKAVARQTALKNASSQGTAG